MDRAIFERVCPGLSLDYILSSLENAVRVFGKNRVSSNFIIGLGETDTCVQEGIETLASRWGSYPTCARSRPTPSGEGKLRLNVHPHTVFCF